MSLATLTPTAPALPLVCHPAAPCALPLRIEATLALIETGPHHGWLLRYALRGDVSRLRVPTPVPPGPADGLWQHTCFEAFIGVAGEAAYREFNWAPSGQWAAYRFSAERQRDAAAEAQQGPLVPRIEVHTGPESLCLLVGLPMSALPLPTAAQVWEVGLSAVIETSDGQLSHWALQHPSARPDFHHRGGWQRLPGWSTRPASAETP